MPGELFQACRGRPIRARQQDSPAPLLGQALLVPALVQTNQRHPRGIARPRHLLSESGDQYLILNSGVGDGLIWHVAPAPCYFAECSSRSCRSTGRRNWVVRFVGKYSMPKTAAIPHGLHFSTVGLVAVGLHWR